MIKKTLWLATALTLALTASNANSEKKVFDSGIRSALKVLKYEKEHSLTQASADIKNKYCVSLYRANSQVIKPFDVVKMESLSLYLEYKPSYLQYSQDGESKNIFCFASGDTKNEAKAKLKAIRARYGKIDNFNPMVIHLDAEGNYKRAIPFLGIWSKDLSETVGVLEEKIAKQKKEIAKQKREKARVEKTLKEENERIKEKLKVVSNTILSISGTQSSEATTSVAVERKTENDTIRDERLKREKEAELAKAEEAKNKEKTKKAEAKLKEKKIESAKKEKAFPDNITPHADSQRVFTVSQK